MNVLFLTCAEMPAVTAASKPRAAHRPPEGGLPSGAKAEIVPGCAIPSVLSAISFARPL
jgi:hypothetical protein